MSNFNPNEEKYTYCCCFDAHVTTLSSILMAVYDVTYVLALFNATSKEDFVPFLGIPIVCLGVYGLYNEARTSLLVYIFTNFVGSILLMVYVLGTLTSDPIFNFPEHRGVALPAALLYCSVVLLLEIPYSSVLWNLTKFIEDRKNDGVCARYQL